MTNSAIVILHGWNLYSLKYQKLIGEFKKEGFSVFAPDFPGFGQSQLPNKPYSLSDYVTFLNNYLSQKGVGKIILIGHSFGGRVGIKFASLYPEKVEKIILTGVPGFRPAMNIKIIFFKIIAKIGKLIFYKSILKIFAPIFKKILYKLIGEYDYTKTSGVMRETFKKIINEDLTSPMSKIKSPTYLIWGSNDTITPIWIAKKMQAVIKDSKLITLTGEGHSAVYKNPELFSKTVIKLLQ